VLFALYAIFPPKSVDIVVMGLDSRDGEGNAVRTDSIILVGVDTYRFRVSMLSIPRDLFITAPNYGLQRINTIHVLGEVERADQGPVLLRESINTSFGIGIDRYIRLDFNGFKALIDAVGGVDIYVERVIDDYNFPTENFGVQTVRFETGWQNMDGERALIYARIRHQDDDYGRAGRQQQIVTALGQKLLNPWHWGTAIRLLSQYADTDLNIADVVVIAPILLLNAGRYESLVIDRDYIRAGAQGALPDYEKLAPYLQTRFD